MRGVPHQHLHTEGTRPMARATWTFLVLASRMVPHRGWSHCFTSRRIAMHCIVVYGNALYCFLWCAGVWWGLVWWLWFLLHLRLPVPVFCIGRPF